jgi:uncharacterized Zn-binding protein involved in type VI secretion
MFGVSRVGDTSAIGGRIIFGASTVFVSGKPAALALTSPLTKKPGDKVLTGSSTVFCEGRPLARVTSKTTSGAPIITGSLTVRTK